MRAKFSQHFRDGLEELPTVVAQTHQYVLEELKFRICRILQVDI